MGGRGWGRGGDCKGGITSGQGGSIKCYKCNEPNHIARDCPFPWWSHCSYFWVNTHSTEEHPKLIVKWEDKVKNRPRNWISSNPEMVRA